jgi:hypothetical protein
MAGSLTAEPARAAARLEPICQTYAALHPMRGQPAANCWFEVGWLAHERGDPAAMERAMTAAQATSSTGGEPDVVGMAGGYLALARGDPAAAVRAFAEVRAWLGQPADQPWWIRLDVAETELGEGLASREIDPRRAEAALERARAGLEVVVAAQPAPQFARRLARVRLELVRLRAARGAPAGPTEELARAAAAWYREAGGYSRALAELERLTGSR